GVLGVVPNTLGMMQANEVIKIILGLGEVASGKLIVYNALTLSLQAIELMKNEKQINIGIINGGHLANCNKTANSGIDKNTFFQLCSLGHHTIIDLREKHETPKLDIKDVVYVPFSELENHDLAFEKNHPLILVCQSGIRSQKALEYLLNLGFSNVVHLHRGVQSLHLHNI
ncbi:MAG TPA: rhodanese-like domain-containing protein, partial [Saprospiraceae bacterium]|nr:rhodanese-like domain-containing protein [Saprospiraceae bacterium]